MLNPFSGQTLKLGQYAKQRKPGYYGRLEDMDGRVLQDLFEPAFIEQTPVGVGGSADSQDKQEAQYSAEEAAIVEERLKAQVYIE